MRLGPSRSATRKLIAALAIAALALRALIPAGFMPAPGRLFSLELCPDGLPSGMLAAGMRETAGMAGMAGMAGTGGTPHHPSGHDPLQIEHCVFGGASAHALVMHLPALGPLLSVQILPAARFTPQRTGWRLLRVPLPRGPPAIA